jgi:hypothetical protein
MEIGNTQTKNSNIKEEETFRNKVKKKSIFDSPSCVGRGRGLKLLG